MERVIKTSESRQSLRKPVLKSLLMFLSLAVLYSLSVLSNLGGLPAAWAGHVTKVQGERCLVEFDSGDGSPGVGDEFFLLDSQGKKKTIIRVLKVDKLRALAQIVKGKAEANFTTLKRGGGGGSANSSAGSSSSSSGSSESAGPGGYNGSAWGLSLAMISDKMDTTFIAGTAAAPRASTANMTGSGIGAMGFYDFPITKRWILHGMAGMEQFNVQKNIATPDCSQQTSTDCNVKINYLSMYGYLRYNLMLGSSSRLWLGAGLAFLIALSKSSTVLDASTISTNSTFAAALGYEYQIGKTSFIPISVEYGLFPPTSDTESGISKSVSANMMMIRIGWGWLI